MGYNITMKTGNMQDAGTNGTVTVRFLHPNTGPFTPWFTLDKSGYNDFEAGDQDTYYLNTTAPISDTDFIEVNLDPTGPAPDWYLEWIKLVEDNTMRTWKVDANCWFNRSVDVPANDGGGGNYTIAGSTDRLFSLKPVPPSNPNIYISTFDGGTFSTWSSLQAIPKATTDDMPALAASGDTLYLAWKGNGDQSMWWSSSSDGSSWQAQQRGLGQTRAAPALAFFNNSIYQTWRGRQTNQHFWWSTLANAGSSWSDQQENPVGLTYAGPALTTLGNTLYMVWRGSVDTIMRGVFGGPPIVSTNDDRQLWWSFTTDGRSWQRQQKIPSAQSPVSPAVAALNNVIYVLWQTNGSDNRMWWSTYDMKADSWSQPQQMSALALTNMSPALATFNGLLYAAWKNAVDQSVLISTFDGTAWSTPVPHPTLTSGVGPALGVFNDLLYLAGNPVENQPRGTPYVRLFPIL
jgi:hypothetical protein